MTLPPISSSDLARTSIYDIKTLLGQRTGYNPDKLKVLWKKKPVVDSKTVKEVAVEDGKELEQDQEVEMGVMYIGSPTFEPSRDPEGKAPTAEGSDAKPKQDEDTVMRDASPVTKMASGTGPTGGEVLKSEEFWRDLEGFVAQRCKDTGIANEAVKKWKYTWEQR